MKKVKKSLAQVIYNMAGFDVVSHHDEHHYEGGCSSYLAIKKDKEIYISLTQLEWLPYVPVDEAIDQIRRELSFGLGRPLQENIDHYTPACKFTQELVDWMVSLR